MRLRVGLLLFFVILLGTLSARADDQPLDLASQARDVLQRHCHRCHRGPGSRGGEFDVLNANTLTKRSGDLEPPVVPGRPAESALLRRVQKDGDMPPPSVRERPTRTEIEVLERWIAAGAGQARAERPRSVVVLRDVLSAIAADLRAADPQDWPYLRYVTLVNLHNHPARTDDDLRLARAAVAKAVNSLSWRPRLLVPRVVDEAGTVLAIDLRDLGWEREEHWEAIRRAYPYALSYGTHPDQELRKLDNDLRALSGDRLTHVRGDWLIATATRPPLYHQLLGLPSTAGELERRLGVDLAGNFFRDRLVRAGFEKSGVSGQNRLVERHDALHGAYWKSYDFQAGTPRGGLVRFPLGPRNLGSRRHPFPEQAFEHAGGEIIFNLPNGLQGYLLVDGEDRRIDAGPEEVVSDDLRTAGTGAVVNGLSCIACHKQGMIPFRDTVRMGTAVEGRAREKVERLHVEAAEMERLLSEDRRRFRTAEEHVIRPFLERGSESVETIGPMARRHLTDDLDRTAVACELGLRDANELIARLGEEGLRALGLGALLEPDGVVKRADWETGRSASLMQRTAVRLGATPVIFAR